jgi:hypothetical protein
MSLSIVRTVDSHGAVEPSTLFVLVNTARHETVALALTKGRPAWFRHWSCSRSEAKRR